jgi:hypothetical protein
MEIPTYGETKGREIVIAGLKIPLRHSLGKQSETVRNFRKVQPVKIKEVKLSL